MIRLLCGGFALVLATALVPQATLPAEAAQKAKSISGKTGAKAGSGSDISPWTVTHGGAGARYHKAPKTKALCTSPDGKPRAC